MFVDNKCFKFQRNMNSLLFKIAVFTFLGFLISVYSISCSPAALFAVLNYV